MSHPEHLLNICFLQCEIKGSVILAPREHTEVRHCSEGREAQAVVLITDIHSYKEGAC